MKKSLLLPFFFCLFNLKAQNITVIGSSNIEVGESINLEEALQLADSINNALVLDILKIKDDQIANLINIIKEYKLKTVPGLKKEIAELRRLIKQKGKQLER